MLTVDRENFSAEELLEIFRDDIKQKVLLENVDVYIVDQGSGEIIGSGDIDTFKALYDEYGTDGWNLEGSSAICRTFNDRYLIFLDIVPQGEFLVTPAFVAAFIAFYFVLLAVVAVILFFLAFGGKTRKLIHAAVYALFTVWIFVLLAASLLPYIGGEMLSEVVVKQQLESYLDSKSLEIGRMSDGEVEKLSSLIRENTDDELVGYAENKSDGDTRLFILYSCEYCFTHGTDWLKETSFGKDVFNEGRSANDNITVGIDEKSFVNDYVEYLLQALMLTVMGIVLLRELLFYKERDRTQYARFSGEPKKKRGIFIRHYNELDTIVRMRFLFGLKSIADSMTLPVSVALITNMLMESFDSTQLVLTIIFAIASATGVFATTLIPLLLKILKNSIRFYRFALVLSAAGSVLCIFSSHYIGFVLGYFIITFGDTLSTVVFLLHPLGIEDDHLAFKGVSSIVSGRYFGQIIGLAVGSVILSTFFEPKNMYVISLVLIIIVLVLTINFPMEGMNRKMTEHINLKGALKNPSVILFCLLVMVPYGFANYYIKIVVPIDIAKMGLTTTLVSFYSFVQIFGKSSIGQVRHLKKFWKKFKPAYAVIISMLLLAGLLFAYYVTSGFVAFCLIALLVCIVQSRMGSLTSIHGFETMGNNREYFFANNTMRSLTSAVGKTIAPLISQFFSPLCLPGIMTAGTIGYFISLKVQHKKQKEQPPV